MRGDVSLWLPGLDHAGIGTQVRSHISQQQQQQKSNSKSKKSLLI